SHHAKIPLELVLFVLNSGFADRYFRLGSSNAAVSHYQLTNIPCPRFGGGRQRSKALSAKKIDSLIEARKFPVIEEECIRLAVAEGCSTAVERVIVSLVKFIEREEKRRGQIARTERSHLAEDAEKCQAVLDKVMLVLLGLGDDKHDYIRARLAEML